VRLLRLAGEGGSEGLGDGDQRREEASGVPSSNEKIRRPELRDDQLCR